MPKMKTNRGAAKRFRKNGAGEYWVKNVAWSLYLNATHCFRQLGVFR